ncbi:8239_t:CDS:2, partial [Paraglomus occultum]
MAMKTFSTKVYLGDIVRISGDSTNELGLVSKTWFEFEDPPEEDSISELPSGMAMQLYLGYLENHLKMFMRISWRLLTDILPEMNFVGDVVKRSGNEMISGTIIGVNGVADIKHKVANVAITQ